ncbi:MAG: TonB-dependent receptor [Acidobacteriota bacterium]
MLAGQQPAPASPPPPPQPAEPELEFEEDVVVTATRADRRLQDEPLRVEVIGREEIEEKALMTPGSVAMLLGETTGLRVQTTAPSLGAANVRIQGLRGRYAQMLADGLPLYGASGDSLGLLQVPPLDLGQVEIIKGAASALYGPAALGGVINLVSRRPRETAREALVNVTSNGGRDLTTWLGHVPGDRWRWSLLGGYHGQARRDLDDDGWTDVAGYERGVVRPRVYFDSGTGRTLFATAGVIGENREGGTVSGRTAPDGRPFAEAVASRRADAGVVARMVTAGGRVVSARGSYSRFGRHQAFGEAEEDGVRSAWFGEATVTGVNGAHTWVAGAAVQQDRYDARTLPAFDYRFVVPGVFVQDDVVLGPAASASLSARVDWHDEYGTLVSPRLSALLRPASAWTLRLSAGAAAFAPTPFTEETDETGLSRLAPLGGLSAERARAASADLAWTRGPFELSGTLFGSIVDDAVQIVETGPASVALINAPEPTRTWGTEASFRYRRRALLVMATHALTRATEPAPGARVRRSVPLTPDHVASFNLMWETEEGRVGLETYYIGAQTLDDDPYRDRSPRHVLVGALFERRVGRVRVFVNVENAGNVRQSRHEPLIRPARRPDGRWTVDAWGPLDGRVVNGGIRVGFGGWGG